jgi:hypothetical protein
MGKHDQTGRSKGHDARHVRLYEHIEKTTAWRDLSGIASKAWLTVNLMFNGSNNGKLAISSRELGKRIGVSHATAARALLELENAGFLRMTKASAFGTRRAAEFRLTHLPNNLTGEPATYDFKRPKIVGNVAPIFGAAE